MILALIPLAIFAIVLYSWATAYTAHYQAEAQQSWFQGWLNYIAHGGPFGTLLSALAKLFTQAVTNAAGRIAAQIDKPMGVYFHTLARTVEDVGNTALQASAFALTVARYMTGNASRGEVAQAIRQLRASVNVALHAAEHTLQREITQQKIYTHSVAQGVLPRLRTVEHDVTKVIPKEIKTTRHLAREAEQEAARAFKKAKAIPWPDGVTTWAGAIAVGIADLGLSWTRCNSNPFNNNTKACSLWGDLGRLLGLAAFLTAAFDFADFVKAAEVVAEGIGGAVGEIEGVFALQLEPLPPPNN